MALRNVWVMPTLIDLSHDLADGTVTYPGLPAPRVSTFLSRAESVGRYEEGTTFEIGMVELCSNTGTYLDTPYHRYPDGHDLTGLPLERCADLPAVVVHRTPESPPGIDAAELAGLEFAGCAVLFDTGWSRHWGSQRYGAPDHPFVGEPAVDALIAGGAVLVGIDSLNIDSTQGSARPAHTKLLAADVPIVEHLADLSAVPSVGARFTAVPPKLSGLGTFTVRAFALVPDPPARPAICEVVFDCADPVRLAEFWAAIVGGEVDARGPEWATAVDRRPGGLTLGFQRVPEGKTVKNRVHVDVWSDDLAADTARAVAHGASTIGGVVDEEMNPFQVLADPEGNEFCFVT